MIMHIREISTDFFCLELFKRNYSIICVQMLHIILFFFRSFQIMLSNAFNFPIYWPPLKACLFFCKALIFLLRKFTKYVIYHQIVGFFKIHSMPLHFFLTTILSGLKYWVFFSSSIFFIRSPMLQHFLIFDSDLHFLLRDFRVHIF